MFAISVCRGQQFVVSTLAGAAPAPTPASALDSAFPQIDSLTLDSGGNAFFAAENCVYRLSPDGIVTLVAGTARPGYSGDGGPAVAAQLFNPNGLATDSLGNLFIADTGNARVRRVSPTGIITTIAGTGTPGSSGNNGPAVDSKIIPRSLAVDSADNLYIGDISGNTLRKVGRSGIITAGYSLPIRPWAIAFDSSGNLLIAEGDGLSTLSPGGILTAIAPHDGVGCFLSYSPDAFCPVAVAAERNGSMVVVSSLANTVVRISSSWVRTVLTGGGQPGYSGDDGPPAKARINRPAALAVNEKGNILIGDTLNGRIRIIAGNTIATLAGGGKPGNSPDRAPATSAPLRSPAGVAVDDSGNVYIADTANNRVRKVSATGLVTTVAGTGVAGYSGDGGPAIDAQLNSPEGVAVDNSGHIWIADTRNGRIRLVTIGGNILTPAGGEPPACTPGYIGDHRCDLPQPAESLPRVTTVAVDTSSNYYFRFEGRIRKVTPSGVVSAVAGNGVTGYSGDDGPALLAQVSDIGGFAFDSLGQLLIADAASSRIRKVQSNGFIVAVAGNGSRGCSGDGGPALQAQLARPVSLAVDKSGNIFIADSACNRIRMVSTSGIITTVAGTNTTSTLAHYGDGGFALSANLAAPTAIAFDSAGSLLVADSGHNAVRVLRSTTRNVVVSEVVDAASERTSAVSPGKFVLIYGDNLASPGLAVNQPSGGRVSTSLGSTSVSFGGIPAPVYYTLPSAVAALVPYTVTGQTTNVTVTFQGQSSVPFTVPVAPVAPAFFSWTGWGSGQISGFNVANGQQNSAINPARIGEYVGLFATGEGLTTPDAVDGRLGTLPWVQPRGEVTATIGGIPAPVQYAGSVYGVVAGVMQLNLQIPSGVQPGGYVPVVLTIGGVSTVSGANWIAVSGN